MLIGYARTSTVEQRNGLEAQIEALRGAGCEKLFFEQVSSVAARPQLDACLGFLREGDTLIVTKLDRLARSVAHLVTMTEALAAKGASLRVLGMNLDTSTPTGKLMLNILGSIAEFERGLMLARQREGIARAKAAGKYRGRAPSARAKSEQILQLRRQGIGATAIASTLGVSRASVYRVLKGAPAA